MTQGPYNITMGLEGMLRSLLLQYQDPHSHTHMWISLEGTPALSSRATSQHSLQEHSGGDEVALMTVLSGTI